jgi:hypothetical protein
LLPPDGQSAEEDALWNWDIVSRLQALLNIALASSLEALEVTEPCRHCQRVVSLELPLVDFLQATSTGPIRCKTPAGDVLALRLPTGADQRRWLEQGEKGAGDMAFDLLEDTAPHSEDLLAAIEAALVDADPLTALNLQSDCPYCETEMRIPFDLEAELLRQFRVRQTQRLGDVHRLARAYHWSEDDILGLPEFRRQFYLSCLRAEGAA